VTRVYASNYRNKKRDDPDPFPVHALKRVDRPTTLIQDNQVQRVDERDGGFQRADRGQYGEFLQREYGRFMTKHPLSAALLAMTKTLAPVVDGTVKTQSSPVTDDPIMMARHIKETAYFLRADMVGICELPPYAVFTHSRWDGKPLELNHKYAISILVDQDWKTAAAFTGNDWISNSMSFVAYSTSAFISCVLAEYIRQLGYPARAHHAMNYQVVVPPILLWAGLGEMSRMGGTVINPFLGPRFKAAVVTTDLPLALDKPIDFGLQDFCNQCGKCADHCPSQAISYGDKVMHNSYERWPLDVQKCTSMRVGNKHGSGCGACIKVCPWNKPDTPLHRTINWMLRNIPLSRGIAVKADDWFGYGKPEPELKWWLDLELIDDQLQAVPPSKGK
jgi:reductive dehalogenase